MIPTIIVADDHPLFRTALKQALTHSIGEACMLEAANLDELEQQINPEVDLILLDLHMPGVTGFSGLIYLRNNFPSIPVVVVSGNEQSHIMQRALQFGALGFVPKSSTQEAIGAAITHVLKGNVWLPESYYDHDNELNGQDQQLVEQLSQLTPQQFKVLIMLNEGLLNKQIAYELNVSEATIKAHVTAILRKLNVYSRTQAVIAINHLKIDDPKDKP